MNENLKAILFDFDGTLADTRGVLYQVYDRLAEDHDLPAIPHEELDQIRALPITERFKRMNVPLLKLPRLFREALRIFPDYMELAEPYPGIEEMLALLKKERYPLIIISSNTVESIEHFLEAHQLELFDRVVRTPGLFGKHRTISHVLNEIEVPPTNALYIGDELRDIKASKKVPLQVAAVTWGYDHPSLLKAGEPDYLVDSPAEIITLAEHF